MKIRIKKFLNLSLLFLATVTLWGCSDNSTGSNSNLDEATSVKQFVWNSMNYWYYWQTDVPELADDMEYFESGQDYHNFLMEFADAESVYDYLIYEQDDDFSFFIDDYEAFLSSQQGVSRDFGFEFGLVQPDENSTDIFGYVQYVLDGTPADEAGLERGDIFTGINGTQLTINNYRSALSADMYELTMAEPVDGQISENGEIVSVQATQLEENPILISKIFETGSSKVGYLLYNSFQLNSHQNLNTVFGNFASEGIDEFVLDLRYNGGGTVITSAILAGMISGLGDESNYINYTFNQKRASRNTRLSFQNEIPLYNENREFENAIAKNSVTVNRVFVLTGFGTASASEAVINGLRPYMDVIIIGRQTVGKDDVSYTLYDTLSAPYTNRNNASPNHKMALQPIVAKAKNANNESNNLGFMPDFPVNEISFLGDLPPLGEENDPLLAKALEQITGTPIAKALQVKTHDYGEMFKDSRDLNTFEKNMYLTPGEAEKMGLNENSP